jgi:hypothetical protein
MPVPLLAEGPDLQVLLADIAAKYGTSARVVRQDVIRRGGVAGFFAQQMYRIVYVVDDAANEAPPTSGTALDAIMPAAPAAAAAPAVNTDSLSDLDALIAAMDAAEQHPSEPAAPVSQSTAPAPAPAAPALPIGTTTPQDDFAQILKLLQQQQSGAAATETAEAPATEAAAAPAKKTVTRKAAPAKAAAAPAAPAANAVAKKPAATKTAPAKAAAKKAPAAKAAPVRAAAAKASTPKTTPAKATPAKATTPRKTTAKPATAKPATTKAASTTTSAPNPRPTTRTRAQAAAAYAAAAKPVQETPAVADFVPPVIDSTQAPEVTTPVIRNERLDLLLDLRSIGVPVEVNPDPRTSSLYDAMDSIVQDLPAAPALPREAGDVIAIVGDLSACATVVRRLSETLRLTEAALWFSGVDTHPAAAICGADDFLVRRSANSITQMTNLKQNLTKLETVGLVLIATDSPDAEPDDPWAASLLDALDPTYTIAVVDSTRKTDDSLRWLESLGAVDALAIHSTRRTSSPASVWELGVPVIMIDGRAAAPAEWMSLLMPLMSRTRERVRSGEA